MEFSLRLTGAFRPTHFLSRRLPNASNNRHSCRASSSASASSSTGGSYIERVRGFSGPWNSAVTSGVLSAMGDLLAQFLNRHFDEKSGKAASAYDPFRTLRMFGFGFCWYGPFQYYWYNALDFMMPVKNTFNFLSKVAANQLILAPVVLATVFSWNLSLSNKMEQIPDKLRDDLVPTMMNGWKFWVPAASINFYCVPIQAQVLYMSCCGLLWTAYLSYASVVPQSTKAAAIAAVPEPEPETTKKGKKKGKK